jgi:hypothetical protein
MRECCSLRIPHNLFSFSVRSGLCQREVDSFSQNFLADEHQWVPFTKCSNIITFWDDLDW